MQVVAKIEALKRKDGDLAGISTLYQKQLAFLQGCKVEFGFDSKVSTHIQGQVDKFSGDSKVALGKR
nr:hypothetical protein [Pseudomonas sp. BIGb0427]